MHTKTKKIVLTALIASLTCVATMLIKIPSPLKGYLNLGDCVVLLSGWVLGAPYGFLAAGIGSALADLFSGYVTYAPATFIIKGIMAVIAYFCFSLLHKRVGKLPSQIIGAILAELFMILGYFLFEGILYGFAPSLVNIPANAMQGVAGILLGVLVVKIFEKANLRTE